MSVVRMGAWYRTSDQLTWKSRASVSPVQLAFPPLFPTPRELKRTVRKLLCTKARLRLFTVSSAMDPPRKPYAAKPHSITASAGGYARCNRRTHDAPTKLDREPVYGVHPPELLAVRLSGLWARTFSIAEPSWLLMSTTLTERANKVRIGGARAPGFLLRQLRLG